MRKFKQFIQTYWLLIFLGTLASFVVSLKLLFGAD